MTVGMFLVCRFTRKAYENADDDAIGNIRGRVDTVCQQSRAVAHNADAGFQDRKNCIGNKTQVNSQNGSLLPFNCSHNFQFITRSWLFAELASGQKSLSFLANRNYGLCVSAI